MMWKYVFAMDRTLVMASTPLFVLTVESRKSGRWAWRLDANRTVLQAGRADSMEDAQAKAEAAYREYVARELIALSSEDRVAILAATWEPKVDARKSGNPIMKRYTVDIDQSDVEAYGMTDDTGTAFDAESARHLRMLAAAPEMRELLRSLYEKLCFTEEFHDAAGLDLIYQTDELLKYIETGEET